jgi:hypothetical protein
MRRRDEHAGPTECGPTKLSQASCAHSATHLLSLQLAMIFTRCTCLNVRSKHVSVSCARSSSSRFHPLVSVRGKHAESSLSRTTVHEFDTSNRNSLPRVSSTSIRKETYLFNWGSRERMHGEGERVRFDGQRSARILCDVTRASVSLPVRAHSHSSSAH